MVGFPRYETAKRESNPVVDWHDLESDLQDIDRLYGTDLLKHRRTPYELLARHLADRINERHYRKSKQLFDTIQEYRELRHTKNRNDHDKL